jgi:hypothetical protein
MRSTKGPVRSDGSNPDGGASRVIDLVLVELPVELLSYHDRVGPALIAWTEHSSRAIL